jgi:hypothetical protein
MPGLPSTAFSIILSAQTMEETPQKPNNSNNNLVTKWSLVSLAGEFGFIIAIPLVVFGLLGKWMDAKLHTFPWITLAGMAIAITSTTIWMTHRLKSYIK